MDKESIVKAVRFLEAIYEELNRCDQKARRFAGIRAKESARCELEKAFVYQSVIEEFGKQFPEIYQAWKEERQQTQK